MTPPPSSSGAASGRSGGVCWWCCMRLLEKCLPRNDIVRELAPYLQHVHRDDTTDDESRNLGSLLRQRSADLNESRSHSGQSSVLAAHHGGGTSGSAPTTHRRDDTIQHHPTVIGAAQCTAAKGAPTCVKGGDQGERPSVHTPYDTDRTECDFVSFEDVAGSSGATSRDSSQQPPMLYSGSTDQPDAVDEIHDHPHDMMTAAPVEPLAAKLLPTVKSSGSVRSETTTSTVCHTHSGRHLTSPRCTKEPISSSSHLTASSSSAHSTGGQLQKKPSLPKIKTDLGDIMPVRLEKVVLVQISVQGFREMMAQAKDLMEDAKLLYEHTVLSRLSTEYGGHEILSHPRSGLFVIAFASEFHAAKWCLSLQLSLVYAAWNDKLLKQFEDMREEFIRPPAGSKSRKNVILYRGFRVRMVIHAADPDVPPEKSLADAVKWTNSVSEFAHGGQIVLSDSVWDRLKEQLVQLGNPVVEDLGCHSVLDEEVMLMLLLPRDLECRRFPKLKSPMQLSPGMRDAPSAQKPLTMVFTFIEGARPLVRCHAEELAERIKALCAVARELLRKHNGYECQELQGDFMLAFFNPVCAVLWCVEFQLRIRREFRKWNHQAENHELMFSMSMGVETGIPASVSPHKTSGRADYFGNIVNQTARIAKAAHGGQILIGGDAWNSFNTCTHRLTVLKRAKDVREGVDRSSVVLFKAHGYYSFKGISQPIALIEAIPIEPSSVRDNTFAISLLLQTRVPKSKVVTEKELAGTNKTAIEPVPSDMIRLHHNAERELDTIRETELGFSFSWDDAIPIVEEHGSFDEEAEHTSPMISGSAALALSQSRMNHSGLMHIFRSSGSLDSPKPMKTEQMDRL
ncbi:hypothetical protein PINS_up010764 [Pythium insidiosum]|nr:hypothetical protein PINS_up010764 [Pythium insidiosum]